MRWSRHGAHRVAFAVGLAVLAARPGSVLGGSPLEQSVPTVDAAAEATGPRYLVLEGQLGAFPPLGQFGLALDGEVASWLSLAAGVGLNTTGNDTSIVGNTLRVGFASRLHVPLLFWPRTAVVGGVGVVLGEGNENVDIKSRIVGEVSLDHFSLGGVRVRVFGGLGVAVGSVSVQNGADPKRYKPYAGLALGYALLPNPVVEPADSLSLGSWYGWQSLSLDAANAVMLAVLRTSQQYDVRVTSVRTALALYSITSPVVHVAHRKYAKAIGSLILRVGSALLGYEAGKGMTTGEAGRNAARAGLVVGSVLAVFCDAFALGRE
jgi:hypothetical protein